MRALRVVGITEDNGELSVVLEDLNHRERYTVPADEQLRAAARGDLTRLGQIAIELESQLRPREIQARIRAGASVDQVAAAAGVPTAKIERFAYPVLLERTRTADLAQRAHPVRDEGPDSRMLGDVVAHTFGLRGQDYDGGEWDSWKGEDGRWVVALSWRAGRSDNVAHWTFQPGAHGGTVTALDEHAHDLVEGLQMRPLRTVGPVIDMTRPEEQEEPAVEEVREVEHEHVVGRRTADGTDAPSARVEQRTTPVEPRRPAPPAQRKPAATETAPQAAKAPAAKAPAVKAPAEPEIGKAAPAKADTAPKADPAPAETAEPAAPQAKRTKKGKPVMPSWDEVLLGVRGQR